MMSLKDATHAEVMAYDHTTATQAGAAHPLHLRKRLDGTILRQEHIINKLHSLLSAGAL